MERHCSIRPATSADLPAINDIYNFYVATSPATFDLEPTTNEWRANWFAQGARRDLPVLVADAAGGVVGWVCLMPWSPKGAYARTVHESIYIADPFRGQGVGKALLSAVLAEARGLDLHVVMAGVVACQDASLALHRSLGFLESGRYLHMGYKLGAWHDVVWLQRHLWRSAD